jgi:SpoVK/Ycf46/Vps4 family AAA+-type ATPase
VVKEAMMMPVRRCQSATKFRQVADGMLEPTYPSDPNGIEMTLFSMDSTKLKAPDVSIEDFHQAIARIKPSVS